MLLGTTGADEHVRFPSFTQGRSRAKTTSPRNGGVPLEHGSTRAATTPSQSASGALRPAISGKPVPVFGRPPVSREIPVANDRARSEWSHSKEYLGAGRQDLRNLQLERQFQNVGLRGLHVSTALVVVNSSRCVPDLDLSSLVRPAYDLHHVLRRRRGGDRPRHPEQDAPGVHTGRAPRILVVTGLDKVGQRTNTRYFHGPRSSRSVNRLRLTGWRFQSPRQIPHHTWCPPATRSSCSWLSCGFGGSTTWASLAVSTCTWIR